MYAKVKQVILFFGDFMKHYEEPSSNLYPNPVVLVSAKFQEKESIIAIAWVGTCCSSPPIISISVRKERYSYDLIKNSREFVINVPLSSMVDQIKICGTKSGRDSDKWAACNFIRSDSKYVSVPGINECPVNIECKVINILEIGVHDLILGEVLGVKIDKEWKEATYPNMVTFTKGIYKENCSL